MTSLKTLLTAVLTAAITASVLALGCASTNENNPPTTTGQKVDKAVDEVGAKSTEAAKPIKKALGTDTDSPDGGAKAPR